MPTTTTGNAELRRLGRRLPSPLALRRLPPHRRRRRARTSGPSGGLSSTRPNAARGFLSHALGVIPAQAQAQCCELEVAYRLLSKAKACAGVIYTASASPFSSSPSSSPFPERRSLRRHHIQPPPRPLPRSAEPFLDVLNPSWSGERPGSNVD